MQASSVSTWTSPFDLHVLSTPPAFILSQDQTLCENVSTPFRLPVHCAHVFHREHRCTRLRRRRSQCERGVKSRSLVLRDDFSTGALFGSGSRTNNWFYLSNLLFGIISRMCTAVQLSKNVAIPLGDSLLRLAQPFFFVNGFL